MWLLLAMFALMLLPIIGAIIQHYEEQPRVYDQEAEPSDWRDEAPGWSR